MAEEAVWYYLHPDGQNYGPYTKTFVQELQRTGYVLPESLIWREGQEGGWLAYKNVLEMQTDQEDPGTTTSYAGGAGASEVDELDLFKAEIMALEGEVAPLTAPSADKVLVEPPASPPEDERRFEDDDGTAYVWNVTLRKFVPEEAAGQFPEYDMSAMTYEAEVEVIPEYNPPGPDDDIDEEDLTELEEQNKKKKNWKKRKAGKQGDGDEDAGGDGEGEGEEPVGKRSKVEGEQDEEGTTGQAKQQENGKGGESQPQPEGWFELKYNTSVYITGLPDDVTEAELVEVFSKCGLVKEDEARKPKAKVYRDKDSGMPKGDGLVTYLKEPSVDLALQILDGAPFRPGMVKNMTVTKAKFEQKGDKYIAKKKQNNKKKKKDVVDRRLNWGGFDDMAKAEKSTVILKHMFHPDEFLEDPGAKKDLENDVVAECVKLGSIKGVRVFPQHLDGIVSVRFNSADAAAECINIMNGRFFGGRRVEAGLWDGVTNYNVKVQETAGEQEQRLERFAQELEQQ